MVVAFDLSEAMSAPVFPGRIMVKLLFMPYFYVRGEGAGVGWGLGARERGEGEGVRGEGT